MFPRNPAPIALVTAVLALTFLGCAATHPIVKVVDIKRVNPGDTFGEVQSKLGEPHQILSNELVNGGTQKAVWLYEAVPHPRMSGGP